MSAPQIPNLQTLRRGGLRGRGAGRRQPGDTTTVSTKTTNTFQRPSSKDEIIRNTDNDAATSRISAVEAGYLEDPFAVDLGSSVGQQQRRLPLMNRGTYVRTTGIDRIVETFLSSSSSLSSTSPSTSTIGHASGQTQETKQIISLGAGSDTRFFRLRQKHPSRKIVYHEIDFESNTKTKISRLQSSPLKEKLGGLCQIDVSSDFHINQDGSRLTSPNYYIHPQDLRQIPTLPSPLPGIDTSLATLIISECCLIYLPPDDADSVLEYFSTLFPSQTPLSIAIYEPIRPHDAFGKTMVGNLIARGIHLQTLEKYSDLKHQKDRLSRFGFSATHPNGGARAADVDFIWRKWVDQEEKERVEGVEWMDEVEEFVLLTKHYCIAWGWRGFAGNDWLSLPSPEDR